MSVVAPVTVAWQRVRDFALSPDDNKKRIETFSTLDTAINRAREVIRKAKNPNDNDYGGSNSQAHITLHPGNYNYGTTLSQNDLEDVFITILPGAFTQQETLNLPQNSQDNIADLKLIGQGGGAPGGGPPGLSGPVLELNLGGTAVEGGIQVRDGNTVSQLLYDTVDGEWLIGDDTVIEGNLTVEQSLNVPDGITGDILPSGVPAESVTFIDETSGEISGQTVFSYDESEELLSVPSIELENGTAVSEIKTTSDGDSGDALVTEGALDDAKLDVTGGGGTTVSGIDELTFDGIGGVGASILDDGDGTATLEVSAQQLNAANFVSTSGDTMDGRLTLDAGLRFASDTQLTVTEISDTVSSSPNNNTLVTEAGIDAALNSFANSQGVDALEDGSLVTSGVSEFDFQNGVDITQINPNRIRVDVSAAAGNALQPSDVISGDAIEVTQEPNNQILIDFAGKIQQVTFDGDAIQKEFVIPHGFSSTPESWMVQAVTDEASGVSHVDADDTNLYVRYDTAPPSGNGNIVLNWLAKKS